MIKITNGKKSLKKHGHRDASAHHLFKRSSVKETKNGCYHNDDPEAGEDGINNVKTTISKLNQAG